MYYVPTRSEIDEQAQIDRRKRQQIAQRGPNIYEQQRKQARRDGDGARRWAAVAYCNGATSIPAHIMQRMAYSEETEKAKQKALNNLFRKNQTDTGDIKMSIFERVTIHTVNSDGWKIDFELKPGQQPKTAIDWLSSNGYQPAPIEAAATAVSTPYNPADTAVHTFAAEQMIATVADGNVYWKIKGGQYQKFGVSIWPEALEASGFDPENMNPMKPIDLTGKTAHFTVKENGQPRKVIKLS